MFSKKGNGFIVKHLIFGRKLLMQLESYFYPATSSSRHWPKLHPHLKPARLADFVAVAGYLETG